VSAAAAAVTPEAVTQATVHMLKARLLSREARVLYLIAALLGAWFGYLPIRYNLLMEKAVRLHGEAEEFERRGRLQDAYHRYAALCEGIGIDRSDVPSGACQGEERIRKTLTKSRAEIEKALDRHFETAGSYPDSLNEVKPALSGSTSAVVDGFRYEKREDGRMHLSDGLIVHRFTLR